MIPKKLCIVDIETSTNLDNPELKYFGIYSYANDTYYKLPYWNTTAIQKLISYHDYIDTFNGDDFDIPCLKNAGYKFFKDSMVRDVITQEDVKKSYHIKSIDLFQIVKKRGFLITKFKSKSLANVAKTLGIEARKDEDFDYEILNKYNWTDEEITKIEEYLQLDLEVTKQIFEYMYDYFHVFEQFVSEKNKKNMSWLTSSSGALSYKILCNLANLPEIYNDVEVPKTDGGGLVITPKGEYFKDIWYYDFACIPEGEMIHTTDGYKKIEDIKVYKNKHHCYNSKTYSQDKNINWFIQKRSKKVNKLIKLELNDGTTLLQTPEHRLLTSKGDKKAEIIKIGDELIKPKHTPIKQGKYDELFQLLGIFVCEGSLFRQKRFIKDYRHPKGRNSTVSQTHLGIKKHEVKFKKIIDNLIKKYVPFDMKWKTIKKTSDNNKYECFNLFDTRKEVYDWFYNFKDKYYNLEEITKNEGRCKAFIKGCFQSDACWNVVRNSIQLNTTDKERINIIKKCLQCLGIGFNCVVDKKKYTHMNKAYRLEIINVHELYNIFKWFKWNTERDNKVVLDGAKANKIFNNRYVKVINVELIDKECTVYDLGMKRQESPYFIHNGMFTHNSLYPHIMMMFNMFGNPTIMPDNDNSAKWFKGNENFKVNGKYRSDTMHKLAMDFSKMYLERKKLKKTNPRLAYAYKIILNGAFGVLMSPIFASTYYEHTGADICWLGQQFNKLAQKFFANAGFITVSGDTDSVFLKCTKHWSIEEQRRKLQETKNKMLDYIKANVPFPCDHFDMDCETTDENDVAVPIKFIQFYKSKKTNKYLKKNYFYMEQDGSMTLKGLAIKKDDATRLSMHIYNNFLKEQIKTKLNTKFDYNYIKSLIRQELEKDITLIAKEFKFKDYDMYKTKKQIQAQISKQYNKGKGGQMFMIKNKSIGKVGVKDKYCTVDEFKELVDRRGFEYAYAAIDFDKVMNELEPFTLPQQRNLDQWGFK